MQLPGLIDPHVHLREPGATHKEDWDSGTAAALAGGFTTVLAMPNTQPPVTDAAALDLTLAAARAKARCDYAQYLGAGADNLETAAALAPRVAGLKMYLDQTYGPLRLDDMTNWMLHFARWPKSRPLVAHAESRTMAAVILLAAIYNRPVHLAHVSLREEIILIRAAKARGIPVTCEVAPHHLFLTAPHPTPSPEGREPLPPFPIHPSDGSETPPPSPIRSSDGSETPPPSPIRSSDGGGKGGGRFEVRPRLAAQTDVDALWANLDAIDCFATDHAPHTLAEKDSPQPPPGFPGLETALPLLLTAVHAGRLTLADLLTRMVTNPRKIFGIPAQPETWIEVDPDVQWEIHASEMFTRCGWTPFEGWQVRGKVRRVVLRGQEVYFNGKVLAQPGSGRNIRG